ncbi:PolC-type DNA polymerase III [Alcanivorax sp. 1008]|uniref:3'-5' exonuclease n=1 Tax=Alcanivorax sp. 1008 TaxID=2816853 RepID=UPI001DA6DF65|nr:3'-5' exonuclease [Alcanivorax sp. 1008]MCC1497396.1 3'-5' exonuclease [Alcanivorax sp. 1008]
MHRYAVIDFETNGLMPGQGGRALEVAAVIVEGGEIVASWQSLMNPGGRVPRFITDLTGITPAMVRAAPSPDEVMTQIHEFVGDATLVAHNASFDRRFWEHELDLCGRFCSSEFLCTVLIGRRLYPWAPNHKLATLVELHNIPVDGRHHRALADASMTARLFQRMQQDLTTLYAEQTAQEGFLQRYQRISRAQAKSIPPFYS